MHFEGSEVYHVYNRGNDRQRIFFGNKNYEFFLRKVKNEWSRYCDILSYCLMPNHFHFMVYPYEKGCQLIELGGKISNMQNLSKSIGKTLSSYTKAINIQNSTRGNLFQKKTKAKQITGQTPGKTSGQSKYIMSCFHYIHNNPVSAGLVKHPREWPFSSYNEYFGTEDRDICNRALFLELAGIQIAGFNFENIPVPDIETVLKLF